MPAAARSRLSRPVAIASGALAFLLGAPSIASAAPPSNDAFADRTVVPNIPYSDDLNTEQASYEPGEPEPSCNYGIGKTVWYEYTPAVSGVVSVDTQGSSFDTVVAVWTGGQLESLSEVACSDDHQDSDGNWLSTANAHFPATAGTTYLIQAGGYYDYAGDLSISVSASTLGSISGVVTSSDGGALGGMCVDLNDADSGYYLESVTTNPAGSYFFGGLADGAYKVFFYDCYGYNYEGEWFDNQEYWDEANRVVVSGSTAVTGIDAALDAPPGPELGVYVDGPGIVTSEPAGIDCGLDCAENFDWDSVITLTATPDADASFVEWYGCDRHQGNVCQVDMYWSRYVSAYFRGADTDPPNTTIWSGPEGFSSARSARFDFYSDEWPPEFECSLDGATFEPCGSPAYLDDLAEGGHEFLVRAIDEAGNVDPTPARRRWTVDSSAPDLVVQRPTAGLYSNNQSIGGAGPIVVHGMVSVEVRATDAESGISAVLFEVNGVAVDPSRVTADGDVYRFAFRPATPGTYDIRARATNQAGASRSTAFQVIGSPG